MSKFGHGNGKGRLRTFGDGWGRLRTIEDGWGRLRTVGDGWGRDGDGGGTGRGRKWMGRGQNRNFHCINKVFYVFVSSNLIILLQEVRLTRS